MCAGSNSSFRRRAAHPRLRASFNFFGKHFLAARPCNLHNRPSSALPISQAWNVGRTAEARLQRRQIALYPLTCQRGRQMNSPSIINGIKEHLHWHWIAQSSSANTRKINTAGNVTAGGGSVKRLIPTFWYLVLHVLACGRSDVQWVALVTLVIAAADLTEVWPVSTDWRLRHLKPERRAL